MKQLHLGSLAALLALAACGPAGTISGRVTVEGGSAGSLAVVLFGPQSAAAVTRDDGTFSFTGLPDGAYVVRATVRGAEAEEQNAGVTVANGVGGPEALLTFRMANARVTGKVVFSDGSSGQNVAVTAIGSMTKAAVTAADGSFSLEGLRSGAYLVTAEAPDTREGRVSVSVEAGGVKDVGELTFTPVGRLTGTVTASGSPAPGVSVSVPGTSLAATTDEAGAFELTQVPTGAQTVLATVGSVPFVRSATQLVTVARGDNPAVTLALTDEPPPTGTVTGLVTFNGDRSPRDITVSVAGLPVTATPQLNGTFSLTVPVGAWDIVATAPLYPRQVLGRVEVLAGQTVALPGAELSWYRPVWVASSPINVTNASPLSTQAQHPWIFLALQETERKLALLNLQTAEFRVVAIGPNDARLSSRAKYLAWAIQGTAFVYELATGQYLTFPNSLTATANPNINAYEFSTDESVLFVRRSNNTLQRIPLAQPANAVIFPATGSATAIDFQNADRWFVREGTEARLVTPTTDVAQVFTNIMQFSVTPTAWALTDCPGALSCTLRVLSPTGSTAQRINAVNPSLGELQVFNTATRESRADYPCFVNAGTASAFCVRSSDGAYYPLPGIPSRFVLNDAGTRVLMAFPSGGQQAVREETMPPSSGTSSAATSAFAWNVAWVSPTRGIAYESGGTTRTMVDFKMGTPTLDTDLGSQAVSVSGPMVLFPKASTARWRVFIGDKATRDLPVTTARPSQGLAARAFGGGESVTDYGAVSFDAVNTYLVDERAMTVTTRPLGPPGAAFRSGTIEFLLNSSRPLVANTGVHVYGTNAAIEIAEGGLSPITYLGSQASLVGVPAISDDGRVLLLGTLAP